MPGARIVYNHFPQLAKAMHVSLADIVFETAEAILDTSDKTVRANSYRTGALDESGKTQYGDHGLTAIVGYNDFKAVWTEYGTGAPAPTRAEPFLTPATEGERGRFDAAVRSIESRLSTNLQRATVVTSASGNVKVRGQGINPSQPRRRR